jgi:hypothetical protein
VVNLWGGDRAFNDTVKRIEQAFPAGTLCLPAEKLGNVIVFGFAARPARWPGPRCSNVPAYWKRATNWDLRALSRACAK